MSGHLQLVSLCPVAQGSLTVIHTFACLWNGCDATERGSVSVVYMQQYSLYPMFFNTDGKWNSNQIIRLTKNMLRNNMIYQVSSSGMTYGYYYTSTICSVRAISQRVPGTSTMAWLHCLLPLQHWYDVLQ